jgi:hypothetical protein
MERFARRSGNNFTKALFGWPRSSGAIVQSAIIGGLPCEALVNRLRSAAFHVVESAASTRLETVGIGSIC